MNQDSLLGHHLAHYRIDRFLGRGGMASVYLGTDTKLDKVVAIKVIDSRHQDNVSYARRFVQEAKSIAKWRHLRIVEIYDAGEDEGIYYYVMEYINGADLRQVLKSHHEENRLMPHKNVIRIGNAFAEALDYIHSKGIIHRDVKPANIMLAQDNHQNKDSLELQIVELGEEQGKRIVLTDFGLAMDLAEGDERYVVSSPWYTAPEQSHRSGAAVPQSDIYSLGVILYEMLVGSVPFDDPSPTSVAIQHLTQPPPVPSELNPALNTALDKVLLKALSKQVADRYQTGKALMEAMEHALRGISLQTDDLQGQQLDEYRLGELLGKGGMARVYRASDVNLRRSVAIKVIDFPHRGDEDYHERFSREAQAIAQLEHPNIVRLYRYGEDGGLFYMAMQYIEGSDLHTRMSYWRQKKEDFPYDEALRIVYGICNALDYAHEKGIIHRDVKPSNVMLDRSGHAYLTDFGLAMLANTETQGEIFGSPSYIAPEQAMSSANVVPQSDLYAVAVMLYEIFTGRLPFVNQNPLVLAMQHMSEKPKPPREIKPSLDPALERVILKGMAKEPAQRYQTGAELAAALAGAIQIDMASQVMDVATVVATPAIASSAPAMAASVRKLDLPPMPAAVVAPPGQTTVPVNTTVKAKKQRGSRGCFAVYVLVLLLFAGLLVGGVLTLLSTNSDLVTNSIRDAAVQSPELYAEAKALLGIVEATVTSEPSLVPTLSPTETAISRLTPSPAQRATEQTIAVVPDDTATPTIVPTETAVFTATPQATGTATMLPTSTPTLTPTPFIVETRAQDGMPMVLLPPTTFIMGGVASAEDVYLDEYSRHTVSLDSYYMDLYEVSVQQYADFLTDIGGYVNSCLGWTCLDTQFETRFSHLTNNVTGGYLPVPGFGQYPINNVSWYGAQAYCAWADENGRLPTEAEWELGARGTTDLLYPWGNELPTEDTAVFGGNNFNNLQPVDSLPAGISPYGLYQMAGNVWEWTLDGYDPIFYDLSPRENPQAPWDNSRSDRVIRGGGYDSSVEELRTTNRESEGATIRNNPNIGFRCIVSVGE